MRNETMNIDPINLPLPYEAYDECRSISSTIEDYRNTLIGWKTKNQSKRPIEDDINMMMDCAEKNPITIGIREWMLDHKDKIVYIYDFSGMRFGLWVEERTEQFYIHDLEYSSREIRSLYPQYDPDHYLSLDVFGKLNWLYDNCEFIPIRLVCENVTDSDSHKWSHIKKDRYAMKLLDTYLDNVKYPPRDNTWYFIQFGTYGYYLKRDTLRSPKKLI